MESINKPWYLRWWGITILSFLFVFIVLGSCFVFMVFYIAKNPQANNVTISETDKTALTEKTKLIEGSNNYFLGKENGAQVVIVEFADFACVHCKNEYPILRQLSIKYKDQIKIIFRDYPSIAEYSVDLANAARCAGEQGLFWPMHDKLFDNQGVSDAATIKNLASGFGVDTEKFNTCFDSQKENPQVYLNLKDGKTLNVQGTPTFFINGYQVSGEIPYDDFVNAIDGILKQLYQN
jgi:protein-disulfide isomerase